MSDKPTRREFLGTAATASAAVATAWAGGHTYAASASARPGPNDTINVGLIGCGGRGTSLKWRQAVSVLAVLVLTIRGAAASAEIVTDGLVVHLDAARQIQAGGASAANATWQNLAAPSDAAAAVLHNFGSGPTSGWVGNGTPDDPYALRFDGRESYVEGPLNIELPEVTLEVWALVEGASNSPLRGNNSRGATLVGNDFGAGGVSLIVPPQGNLLVLHNKTFSPVSADTALWQWQQIAVAYQDGTARVWCNGELAAVLPAPREVQKDHVQAFLLGAARSPHSNYVEADGLVGLIGVVRLYQRALTTQEIAANFAADGGRFGLPEDSAKPLSSMPVPHIAGLAPPAPIRNVKWDYYHYPPRISGTGSPTWPSNARQAFDGYPSDLAQPYVRNFWISELTATEPAEVTINYRRPVAVTRFTHYFIDPAAWREAEVLTSSDGEQWTLLQKWEALPPECPQVLGVDEPRAAKYYRILVRQLAPGASHVMAHEIQTCYGATVTPIAPATPAIQSEPAALHVRVVNPDAEIDRAVIRLVAPPDALSGAREAPLPGLVRGTRGDVILHVTPHAVGPIPFVTELWVDDVKIDECPGTLHVQPKLVFQSIEPAGASVVESGQVARLTGVLANAGTTPAENVRVAWLGVSWEAGTLRPGESRPFAIEIGNVAGMAVGHVIASDQAGANTVLVRPVICRQPGTSTINSPAVVAAWQVEQAALALQLKSPDGKAAVNGSLELLVGDTHVSLIPVGDVLGTPTLVGVMPAGLLTMGFATSEATGDMEVRCRVLPYDGDNELTQRVCDFELHLAVDSPRIMFRPHIDWYTVEHGPNVPALANGHNSATRMLAIQTDRGTLATVPSTDNLTWGFGKNNEMICRFHVVLRPADGLQRQIFRPIDQGPAQFTIALPLVAGDWWDAYRHVVGKVFRFEQPRQWAMPITQLQMLAARYSLRAEVWSEQWQTVRSHPGIDFFYNFYGTTYNIPSLYAWYLVSDDTTARTKAEKQVELLVRWQEQAGPVAGAWFSMYCVEGNPAQMVGRDQAFNRWIVPHATGTAAKTLLWYWEASGKKDGRAFAAARRGCDWLLSIQRPDGLWPYALDLEGRPVSELAGAGQIWCTWALWKMSEFTGDPRYRDAAIRSKDGFKQTFMDLHRYTGYWEDVSGANGKVSPSWEGYEPAIATLVFTDMGDKALAIEAAKDAATWSWTRVTTTRHYETAYGQTTEQSLCGPSQAQSPMVGVGLQQVYQSTGDPFWSDFAGAIKAVNFCADPDQAFGMVATGGWDDPTTGVIGPPYENTRPMVSPNNSKGDEYGRQVWNNWMTDQFAWLALEWLVREANVRAPTYVNIDTRTFRGTVLDAPGRVKMPEEKVDVQSIEHIDVNWIGCQNDEYYLLVLMNHQEPTTVMVRPHEAQLDAYTRPPRILISQGKDFAPAEVNRSGVQYRVQLPAKGTALLIWDRLK